MKKTLAALILSLFLLSSASCGGRVPSAQSAHRKVQKHFQKYGKDNKDSDFGVHKVQKVEIASVQELQKNMAEVGAYVYLADGVVYQVRVILRKKTFGWRVISWETLGKA